MAATTKRFLTTSTRPHSAPHQTFCLAVDGPAASGKSTTTRLVAQRLGLTYIDTGGLYRAATLLAQRQNLLSQEEEEYSPTSKHALITSLEETAFTLRTFPSQGKEHLPITRIYLNGEDVSDDLRTPQITAHVSHLAQIPEVRQVMLRKQRAMASPPSGSSMPPSFSPSSSSSKGIAMDGRDIGTTVFPHAHLKIFLSADSLVRAQRRQVEWGGTGSPEELERIHRDIIDRDRQDITRVISPLRKANDAVELDTSSHSLAQIVNRIVQLALERAPWLEDSRLSEYK